MSEEAPSTAIRRYLREHGLPERLLPGEDVRDATHDPATGRFRVTLRAPVDRDVGGIPVRYAAEIQGTLAQGSITDLSGVKAKKFVWIAVTAMRATPDRMVFTVGPIEKRLPRSLFA